MAHHTTRREFLTTTAATGLGLSGLGLSGLGLLCPSPLHAAAPAAPSTRKKALIGRPTHKTLEQYKAAGYDGMEAKPWDIDPNEAKRYRQAADALDMRIHSVMRGWTNFNSSDASVIAKDITSVTTALRTAQIYGADTVLLVPCKLLAKVPVPKPEDFQIDFDEKTGHVKRVVAGDNASYEGYIQAHNKAVDMSRSALEKLIPVAEKTGVIIALENVWSNLWVKPKLFANFVNSFQSPWVQSYYDIGNHVKYAAPEEWIKTLGKTIVKVHVKDFVIDRAASRGGKFVDIREGDVNWPAVIKAFDQIGYQGWFTIEGSGHLSIQERGKRLDLILAGK